jgi:hypothetical protein
MSQRPASPPLRELRGVVERITYQNPDNGYTVARIAPERSDAPLLSHDDRLVPIVGTLPDLTPGEAIVARGWWRNDARHGWQFTVNTYQSTLPATVQGMQTYLGSGLVKGIGPVFARRIVDTFGEDTFAVIDTTAARLTEVAGIGPVAHAIGMAPDAPARLEAGVLHALGTAAENGHTLLPEEQLARIIHDRPGLAASRCHSGRPG